MGKQYNWQKLKTEFMTREYKSLREFARKQGLPYNCNFIEKTKGWAAEREAKLVQMCSRITENSMETKVEEFVLLKKVFDEAGQELFYMLNQFIENRDCSKFPIKQRKKGTVDIIEVPYIKINDVNKAVNALNKLHKILQKAYPTLSKAT